MSLTTSLTDAISGSSSGISETNEPEAERPEATEGQNSEISPQLESCESAVQQYRDSKLEAARAMRIIGSEELYRERGYETIEEYARARFDFSKQRWYQLTDYAAVHDALKKKVESTEVDLPLPENESQARPLSAFKESPDQLLETWKAVVNRCGSLTRKNVSAAIAELTGEGSEREDNPSGDEPSSEGTPNNNSVKGSGADGDTQKSASPRPAPPDDEPDDENEESNAGGEDSSGDDDGNDPSPHVPPGFFLSISAEAAESVGIVNSSEKDRLLISFEEMTEKELKKAVFQKQPKSGPLPKTSAEPGTADVNYSPLLLGPATFSGRISDEPDPERAIFHPDRMGQIQSQKSSGDRALVCPQVDLFAEVVPDAAIKLVLSSLEGAELTPVLCTAHLERASEFSLPDNLWFGTPADRASLQEANKKLGNFSDPDVRWVLYDVSKKDRENGLPSSPTSADWIVFDPPKGSGISLELGEANQLQEDAQSAGATSSFRRPFKTFSEDYPNS